MAKKYVQMWVAPEFQKQCKIAAVEWDTDIVDLTKELSKDVEIFRRRKRDFL